MAIVNHSELLKNEDVRKEIDRYKWIESEKAGYDIGFEKASRDWLNRYGETWGKQKGKVKPAARSAKRLF